jgi:tetratricopeptide (TPR) repeat protein
VKYAITLIVIVLLSGLPAGAAAPPKAGGNLQAELNRQLDLIAPKALEGDPQAISALAKLETLARQIGEQSTERARVLRILSLAQIKQGKYEDVIASASKSLEIQAKSGALPAPAPFQLHYQIAVAAEALGRDDLELTHVREAVALLGTAPELPPDQRLGLRQKLGYALHKAGDYKEALAVNEAALKDAEKLFGPDDARLLGLLNNTAGNQFELKNYPAAGKLLQRRLDLATKSHEIEIADDSLLQLSLLALQEGDPTAARQLLERRVALVKDSGNAVLIEKARQDLAEFDRKMNAGKG